MKTDSPGSAIFTLSARANHASPFVDAEVADRDAVHHDHNNDKVTTDQVQAAVRLFWQTWISKSAGSLVDAYATNAMTFRAGSVTIEPGYMGTAQRSREYFHEACILHLELGPIEVILLNDTTAVAVYTFQFHALNRAIPSAKENLKEESIPNGRATQIFRRGHDGKLRILHEHMSGAV